MAKPAVWPIPVNYPTDGYIKRMLRLPDTASVLPVNSSPLRIHTLTLTCHAHREYIAIHVRHTNFIDYCSDTPKYTCFASLPVLTCRVTEVQAELHIPVPRIIMLSDET